MQSCKQTASYFRRAECLSCHSRQAAFVLGICTPQLNRDHNYGPFAANQLDAFEHWSLMRVDWLSEANEAWMNDLRPEYPDPRTAQDAREINGAIERRLSDQWDDDDEQRELLETFFAQRELQFAKMGVDDPFTPPIRDFCRELVTLPKEDPARLCMGYLRVGGTVAATFSGSICRDTLAVSMSSLAESDLERYSPGLVLLRREIEWACNAGLSYYDIGVGGARHKERWSDVVRPLFDSYIAFKPQGMLVTMPLSGVSRAKRTIKNNQTLWPLVQKVRRKLFGQKADKSSEDDD